VSEPRETDGRSRFERIIDHEADSYVQVYLAGRDVGQPTTREQKAFIENVLSTDYDGRALIELVQNAHDAHEKGSTDGRILVRLDRRRGTHGVLTVANGGHPFQEANLQAICRIAMSSKPPNEGIGNKGVGFKSILQLTHSPAIFSVSSGTSTEFDGFCFRFANGDDYQVIANRRAPADPEFVEELRVNVSGLKLPVRDCRVFW
jgi:hypothetical protein